MRWLLQLLNRGTTAEAQRNTESLVATFGPMLQWSTIEMDQFTGDMDERDSSGSIKIPVGSKMSDPAFILSWDEASGPWAFHIADPSRSAPQAERLEIFTLLTRSLNSLHLLNVPIR